VACTLLTVAAILLIGVR